MSKTDKCGSNNPVLQKLFAASESFADNKPAQGHTPRPWFVTRGNEIGHDYTDANGDRHVGYVAETLHRGKQAEANARLIAAAPDLLAALERVLDVITGDQAAELGIYAAIAKAEGRAQ